MESGRARLSDRDLTLRLRNFAGTENARAAISSRLPPDFSRAELVARLAAMKAIIPTSPLTERIFAEPEFLRTAPYSPRAQEWDLSRSTLLAALEELGNGPTLRFSLTHSGGSALAIAARSDGAGLGVDFERADREISDAAFARFFRAEEARFLEARLDHWVLKEACFKAHPRSTETIVADYIVTAVAVDEFTILCAKGEPEHFRAVLGTHGDFRYAFAQHLPPGITP